MNKKIVSSIVIAGHSFFPDILLIYIGLAERRQRKNAKKSIMKPQVKHGNDKTPERGPKKKNESKAQAGFALMHGFSATNVGKNRLTVCLEYHRFQGWS